MIKSSSTWSWAHLVLSPCASTISAAGSPACGGTLPRHLLWHRPVNGTWSRLGPSCRSSLGRRWANFPLPSLLIPFCRWQSSARNFWRALGRRSEDESERGEDGRAACPQCPDPRRLRRKQHLDWRSQSGVVVFFLKKRKQFATGWADELIWLVMICEWPFFFFAR